MYTFGIQQPVNPSRHCDVLRVKLAEYDVTPVEPYREFVGHAVVAGMI